MHYFYIAFKFVRLFSSQTARRCLPDCLNPVSIVQIKCIISQPCIGKECVHCQKSLSKRTDDGLHWLSWYADYSSNWQLFVDEKNPIVNDNIYFRYVAIPLKNLKKLTQFLNSTIGKPLNLLGLLNSRFFMISGVAKNDYNAQAAKSFYCAEAFAIVLEWQGYGKFLKYNPGQMTPEQLRLDCLSIYGSHETKNHPNSLI